ncbi:MAG: YHS domain-containing protein [Deltaproteobacteria bacterium]|nr:YHS domain-containing protein [Deltaproteobacteria bacterium]
MSTDRTFLFADLTGFTALTESHGDSDAADVAVQFEGLARSALVGGAVLVKTVGDEVMVTAESPVAGLQVALALRAAVLGRERFPSLRSGLHHGPAVARGADWFGSAVNLAARVAGQARAGEVMCTEAFARAVGPLAGVRFVSVGEVHLKNIAQPVPLCRVVDEQDAASTARAIDPVCRMQVDVDAAPARLCHAGRMLFFCGVPCAKVFLDHPERYAS